MFGVSQRIRLASSPAILQLPLPLPNKPFSFKPRGRDERLTITTCTSGLRAQPCRPGLDRGPQPIVALSRLAHDEKARPYDLTDLTARLPRDKWVVWFLFVLGKSAFIRTTGGTHGTVSALSSLLLILVRSLHISFFSWGFRIVPVSRSIDNNGFLISHS